jgi:hypothetical protein
MLKLVVFTENHGFAERANVAVYPKWGMRSYDIVKHYVLQIYTEVFTT